MTFVAPAVVVAALLVATCSPVQATPETCRTTFDAVARIRGELFFFKHDYFWRVSRDGHLMTPNPVEVGSFWEGLPDRSAINAAYERPDGTVVFFFGRHFWVFWDRRARPGYPRPLSDLGLPEELTSVDTAFFSDHNKATYLVTGDQYWRFNEGTETVETDSPLPVSRLCRGLPRGLDAAFSDNEGQTFFLQGQHYWRCGPGSGRVRSYAPDLVAPRWLGCSLRECCLTSLQDQIETRVWPNLRSDRLSETEVADGAASGAGGATTAACGTLTAATAAAAVAAAATWAGL